MAERVAGHVMHCLLCGFVFMHSFFLLRILDFVLSSIVIIIIIINIINIINIVIIITSTIITLRHSGRHSVVVLLQMGG
jgi:lipopolysaccharide/colanic/teichoic acid biosynthesis glycosyltransferase